MFKCKSSHMKLICHMKKRALYDIQFVCAQSQNVRSSKERHEEEIRMHESQSRSAPIQSHYWRPATLLLQPQFTLSNVLQYFAMFWWNVFKHCTAVKATILHALNCIEVQMVQLRHCTIYCNLCAHDSALHLSTIAALHFIVMYCVALCAV